MNVVSRDFISSLLRESGALVLSKYRSPHTISGKEDPSQIVTEVDVASERLIVNRIEEVYPEHSILAEESGYVDRKSKYTWIVDPIDGTSNFAQGLPWFGVMIALLEDTSPIASGIYLPVTDELYSAAKGEGSFHNDEKFSVATHNTLRESLISFCFDPTADKEHLKNVAGMFARLVPYVRNLRSTNSAVDYAYATDGKLGGAINLKNKIWDMAAAALIATEAGCLVTDHKGREISLIPSPDAAKKDFSFVIAAPALHTQLLTLLAA